ncbi:arginase family protein [Candidatus Woesearchaeota archaeon]|nr:arginase family protein [Candidatus Woesearchaeota archaeon]
MKISKCALAFLFFLLLFAWQFITENTAETSSVVWISLEKEPMSKNLEYAGDIRDYIAASGKITENIDDKFLLQSFRQLSKVHAQNPDAETREPEIENIKERVNIQYNISSLENTTRLIMQYSAEECSPDYRELMLKDTEIYNSTEEFAGKITACIKRLISGKYSSYIFIGTDHGLSLLTFKAAKEINPNAKIGIIVFDEHVDIYGTRDKENIVGKENIFGKLLIEGYADYIVFLGASEAAKQWAQYSVGQDFTRYDIFKIMEIYSDKNLADGKWQPVLSGSIRNMREAGITNIMISVDLDVLPTKYAGFEYSILAPAIASIRFENRSQPSFAESEEGFSEGLEPIEIKHYIRHIKYQAAVNGIKFGTSNGNITILGDIQELLPKQDLNNETARAASQIATFLAR